MRKIPDLPPLDEDLSADATYYVLIVRPNDTRSEIH